MAKLDHGVVYVRQILKAVIEEKACLFEGFFGLYELSVLFKGAFRPPACPEDLILVSAAACGGYDDEMDGGGLIFPFADGVAEDRVMAAIVLLEIQEDLADLSVEVDQGI